MDLAPLRSLPNSRYQLHPRVSAGCVGAPRVWFPLAHEAPSLVSPWIPPQGLAPSGFGYLSRRRTLGVAAAVRSECLAGIFQPAALMGFRTSAVCSRRPAGRCVIRRSVPSCRCPTFAVFPSSGGGTCHQLRATTLTFLTPSPSATGPSPLPCGQFPP